MGWFELLKTQGAVVSGAAYGGEGNEGTDALFNITYDGFDEKDWEEWMRGKKRK